MTGLFRWRLPALLLVAFLLAMPTPARAQTPPGLTDEAFAAQVTAWQKVLDKAAGSLLRTNLSEADYDILRKALTEVFDGARKSSADAGATVGATRPMLEALGKPPAEGAPAEADGVAAERERLEDTLSRFDGRVRQSDLAATRADILLRTANERRINQFAETLFLRGVSPVSLATYAQVPAEAQFLRDRMQTAVGVVAGSAGPTHDQWVQFGILAALALVAGGVVRRHLLRRFGQTGDGLEHGYRRRVVAAAAEALGRAALPSLVIMAAAWSALDALSGLPAVSVLAAAIRAGAGGAVVFLVVAGLGRAVLAPRCPVWRLFGVEDRAADMLAWRMAAATLILAAAGAVLAFLEAALAPPELHAVASFGAKLLGALALVGLLLPSRPWRVPGEDAAAPPVALASRLRGAAVLLALGVVALSALRYHNLGLYVAEMSLASTGALGVLSLLRGVGREGLERFLFRPAPGLEGLRTILFHSERDIRVFQFLAEGVLDLVLAALGVALLLPLSGIAWTEISVWGSIFLRGVKIGEVTLSPVDIVSALAFVAAIMALTRMLQRRIDDRVLRHLEIDHGVSHSIKTGIGYVGAITAIVVGVGTVGLNLSNLALIAGALSVGIGFGLQAIVSNFVAGLILLVERPIKVGDWIVIGEHEGVVKRISVRATEIQTFQHASVIIPNSELISKAVKNWTYKDKFGRIDVAVGISYDADIERARAVLLGCISADSRVAVQPPPSVVFRNFGDSALEFEARCFVPDIESYRAVGTDLRFAIVKAFRENGIDMPYPHRTVRSPELEKIAEALANRKET